MLGIDPASIVPLYPIDGEFDPLPKFLTVANNWIEDRFGIEYFSWKNHWHYAPYELLVRAFTREELLKLWSDSVLSSKLDDHLQENEALTWKVQHSLWRYGCERDFHRFVKCYNGLHNLAVDLPGFEIRITHTRSINTAAWAEHGRDNPIYLDGPFGVLLYYRGEHVMTIGFALSRYGILVAQVQLRKKRGNRFLYKFPMPYLDFAMDIIRRAFPQDDLYLVTGTSAVAAIRAAYGKNADKLEVESAARIERFYDQPLRDYVRTRETVQCSSDDGRVFAQLMRSNDN